MQSAKELILKNKAACSFIKENKINIDENLIPLFSYVTKSSKCASCKGLDECSQVVRGKSPVLEEALGHVEVAFESCKYLEEYEKEVSKRSNLKTISCTFEGFNFENVEVNQARGQVLSKIKSVLTSFKEGVTPKGMYLYGKYGCGKSYLLAFLAKRLSDGGKKVIFAYYPDLVRQVKSSIGAGKLESIVDELKEVDCLFLDDFGGEQNSEFIRDEVLGAVLQDRMMNNLFTCISSNISKELLVDHISNGNKEIDLVKASRIFERIKTLMEFIELDDKNYR